MQESLQAAEDSDGRAKRVVGNNQEMERMKRVLGGHSPLEWKGQPRDLLLLGEGEGGHKSKHGLEF